MKMTRDRYWSDELVAGLTGTQVINDSKTPSGRVHVGALRGVLIHDAVFRSAEARGLPVRYRFGVDDYDPLDELPAGHEDAFGPYLGWPLCRVPAPSGSNAADLAEHYISEFFAIFVELGVSAETYRMRDIYRSGQFNSAIDTLLRHADVVRRIDEEVSGARRSSDWVPFQVLCERCGRIGTTRSYDYDGTTLAYVCEPDLVRWAQGCGNRGRVSPFNGTGKLPWKFEWVAKWHVFPVTVEGAGKDHNARGGSRDVAVRCLKAVFGDDAPHNIPYEFFLVGGAKMSSSRGIGATARDMADFLPPEILRFLILRTPPRTAVDFEPSEAKVTQLFNDFDRHRDRVHQRTATETEARVYEMSLVEPAFDPVCWAPPFDTVLSIVQMPHLDAHIELGKLKGDELSDADRREIERRVRVARYWLDHFCSPAERQRLQPTLPASANGLSVAQRGFLRMLRGSLRNVQWDASTLQAAIFDTARLVPLEQRDAFAAIYCVFLDRPSGPKAGNLLSFLGESFVLQRLAEVPCSPREFVLATAESVEDIHAWLTGLGDRVAHIETVCWPVDDQLESLEVVATTRDRRRQGRRIAIAAQHDFGCGATEEALRSQYPHAMSPDASSSLADAGLWLALRDVA